MKLVEQFATFLEETVNLNANRLDLLDDSVEALKGVLRASDWRPRIRTFVAQGSWAHKTIIKPIDNGAFDADLLVLVDPVNGWEAKEYIASLRNVFATHGTYKDKVRRWSHCITIEYSGERKVDIAPCVVDRGGIARHEVCNFNTNAFESSEPEKYTSWLLERNRWTGGHALRKVTRLHKYLRDIKGTFTCPSILLTTLLGERISMLDQWNEKDFVDVPTALRCVTARLDDWLQARPDKPTVTNPVLSSETFSDRWDDDTYANFRDRWHTYRSWIDDAYGEANRDESIAKWRRVFGDEFASAVVLEKGSRVTLDARSYLASARSVVFKLNEDLVDLFQRFGARALPPGFDMLPHKHRPRWKVEDVYPGVSVIATRFHGNQKVGDVTSDSGPVPKGDVLIFRTRVNGGPEVGKEYDVHWRVANTDLEAAQENCLRGGFYPSTEGNTRREPLKFRGVHTVEAFVIRKRDQALVAQSAPFYVVIA